MGWYGAAVPDRRFRSAGRRFSCGVTPRRLSVLSIGSLAFGVPASQQAVYSRVAAADTGHRPPVPGRRRDTDPQAQMLAREVRPGPQPDLRQQGQQRRASPVPAGQPRHLISEGDSHAARVPAQEPAHRQADQRRPAVLHRAQVPTAHPRRPGSQARHSAPAATDGASITTCGHTRPRTRVSRRPRRRRRRRRGCDR
jgi:hypothetical protein